MMQNLVRFEIMPPLYKTTKMVSMGRVGQREQFAKIKYSCRIGQVSIISQEQETLVCTCLATILRRGFKVGRCVRIFLHSQINIKL